MIGEEMRKIALIAILAITLTSIGCYKNVQGPSFTPTLEGQGWDYGSRMGMNSRFQSSLVKISDSLFLTSLDGKIYRFNAEKGKLFDSKSWNYYLPQGIRSTPAVFNDVLYFGGFDQKLHALDPASGQDIFQFQTKGYISSSPLIVGNVIYFGCYDGSFRAIDLNTRKLLWEYDSKSAIRSGAASTGRGLVFGNEKGIVTNLDITNGSVFWTFETRGEVYGAPAVTSNLVIFGSRDGKVRAVNESDGSLYWEYDPPDNKHPNKEEFWSTPAVDETGAYIGSTWGKFYALKIHPSGTSAEMLWEPYITKNKIGLSDYIYSDAIINGNSIMFGCNNGRLYCLDRNKGTELWSYETYSEIRSKPFIDGDKVIFPSDDHYLYALTISDGLPVRGK